LFTQLPTHQLSLPMTRYTTYHLQPYLNQGPHSSQGSVLTLFSTTRSHSPSPFNLHVHKIPKKVNIPFSDLWDLRWGSKGKKFGWNFHGRCKDTICTCGKISDFFYFFWNLCAISKVALVVFLWLIFKLDFDLDDDLIWI
jgi:hypothetical protein